MCLRTIHEIHKFKPNHQEEAATEIRKFLQFVIGSFTNLPMTMRQMLINKNPNNNPAGQKEPKNIPKVRLVHVN